MSVRLSARIDSIKTAYNLLKLYIVNSWHIRSSGTLRSVDCLLPTFRYNL